jgi:hypothetical protein
MRFRPTTHEVAMSDRHNDLTGGSDGPAADLFDDIPVDAFDALEPASDLDDVAFGLDVNPDEVDLTFDPRWRPSVADRSWGDEPGAQLWTDESRPRPWTDAPGPRSWHLDRGRGD